MDYKEIKKELSLTDADISEFFDYKNANSFATSSAKNRIEKGLATFYTHSKKAWEEKMKGLKLFIWKDVLANYTSGIAFALAENTEEARKIIFAKYEKEERYLSDTLKADLSDEPEIVDTKDGFYVWGGG